LAIATSTTPQPIDKNERTNIAWLGYSVRLG
jgi:hypothetical protein